MTKNPAILCQGVHAALVIPVITLLIPIITLDMPAITLDMPVITLDMPVITFVMPGMTGHLLEPGLPVKPAMTGREGNDGKRGQ